MCGRFVLATSPDRFAEFFAAREEPDLVEHFHPSWNVSPTRAILGVAIDSDGDRILGSYRWGLIPFWAKDASIASRTFNARGETAAVKPMFRSAFRARRLLVPADAFYEWSKAPGELRQPYAFARTGSAPLALAGLWERWRDPARRGDPDAWVRSCTIVTTEAGSDMGAIHDRMPAVLDPDTWERWLDPELHERDELEAMLRPSPAGTLARWRVSTAVGSRNNDAPELVAPLADGPTA